MPFRLLQNYPDLQLVWIKYSLGSFTLYLLSACHRRSVHPNKRLRVPDRSDSRIINKVYFRVIGLNINTIIAEWYNRGSQQNIEAFDLKLPERRAIQG